MTRGTGRRGIAAAWALIVVAVVSALTAAAAARMVSARRHADTYRNRAQADWLARAGYELAVARLLANPAGYTGETVTPIADGEVKIVVTADPAAKGAYRVAVEARYPLAGPVTAVARVDRPAGARPAPPPGE